MTIQLPSLRTPLTLCVQGSLLVSGLSETGMSTDQLKVPSRTVSIQYEVCSYISHALSKPMGKGAYVASNLHSRPNFRHWAHLGTLGSHLIFFSLHVLQACPRRFLGLPALVVPQ